MPRNLVLIPAYNEQDSLAHVVAEIRATLPDVDVVVVDDGSTDATAAVMQGLPVIRLHLPYHVGVGAAEQAGFRFAVANGYERVVRADADGQHRPGDISRLLSALSEENADVVVASRFLAGPGPATERLRRAGIVVLAAVVSAAGRRRLTDTTSGFRAFGPRAIRLCAESHPTLYPEPESLVRFLRAGLRVVEIPVEMSPRYGGRSSIRFLDAVSYMARVLMAILVELLRAPPTLPGAAGRGGDR